ncbi:hypothetical protein [Bifidobacterium eulemuris]|uniref:Uncharacterized protein n=1 Tax=Bifidobacterium eulemuris TaxID=1765219 RepID=A0A7L9SR53_9BIFI|nr:hypothetical protein [Bifidobacterium eulemuris]QOL32647.1 hypothetical protein BE0216_09530 [Bifidobacterium eulemuris]
MPVHYDWFGEDISREEGETLPRAIARWFAEKAANEELRWGNLSSTRFEKCKYQTEAYVEEAIERVSAGKARPGTEVVAVARARQQGCPLFELRWHRDVRQLNGVKKEQIRQYESEPEELSDCVFGLHMHLKDVRSGDDAAINAAQNEHIDRAIAIHQRRSLDGWARQT